MHRPSLEVKVRMAVGSGWKGGYVVLCSFLPPPPPAAAAAAAHLSVPLSFL